MSGAAKAVGSCRFVSVSVGLLSAFCYIHVDLLTLHCRVTRRYVMGREGEPGGERGGSIGLASRC